MERLTKRDINGEAWIPCSKCPKKVKASCENDACVKVLADRLAEYEDAEEQGLLIRLPCKVGDIVYYIKTLQNGAETKVVEADTVKRIILDGVLNQVVISYNHSLMMSDYGRLFFLTREEAEAALTTDTDVTDGEG